MANKTQEEDLRALAGAIEDVLPKIYPVEMGFFLCVAPLGENPNDIADYIGNTKRETAIKWLRETANRLEANEVIPAGGGEA